MAFAKRINRVVLEMTETINTSPFQRFTYVPLPKSVISYLERIQDKVISAAPGNIKQSIDHITLVYIPKSEVEVSEEEIEKVVNVLREKCKKEQPIQASLQGWAYFDGAQKDGKTVTAVVALVNAPNLGPLQAAIKTELQNLGQDVPNKFGFVPHITFCYLPYGHRLKESPPIKKDFVINEIAFANDKIYKFPLALDESIEMTESKKKKKKKRKGKAYSTRTYRSAFPPLFPDRMGTPSRFGGNWGPNPSHPDYGSDTAGAAPAGSHAFSEEDAFERIYQEWSGQYKSGEMTGPTPIGVTTQDSTYPDQNQGKVDTGRYDWRNSSGLGFKTEKANTVWKMALDVMAKQPELSETAILMTALQRAQLRIDQFAPEEIRLLQMGIQWYLGDTGARNANVDKSAFGQSKAPSH